jgi:hypothetical protein
LHSLTPAPIPTAEHFAQTKSSGLKSCPSN